MRWDGLKRSNIPKKRERKYARKKFQLKTLVKKIAVTIVSKLLNEINVLIEYTALCIFYRFLVNSTLTFQNFYYITECNVLF